MTTGVISPVPILRFEDNAGNALVGGAVLTQVGGVNTATYADVGLTTPLPNPIVLNSRGEVSNSAGASSQCFLLPNTAYTFTVSDSSGNQLYVAQYVAGGDLNAATIGATLWPETTVEANAGVTIANYAIPNDAGLVHSSRYSTTNTWDYRHDQRLFEIYLSKYGAVFNGSADDGPAISDALGAMVALGGYRRQVIMPSGGLTAKINSGFTITTGALGIDFNGLKIDATAISSGNVITIDQSAAATYNPESTVTPVKNLYLLGDSTAGNTSVLWSINGLTNDVVNVLFENIHFIGGNVAINLVQKAWLLQFLNCACHAQLQYGFQFTGTTTTGESISWRGGAIGNVGGTALYFPQPATNSNNQLNFAAYGTSFDGCAQVLNLGQGTVDLFGCNFEGPTGTGAMFSVTAPTTGPQTQLRVLGGSIESEGSALTSILSISGGEAASAELDCDMEVYGESGITLVERTGNCTVGFNLKGVNFGGATAANFPAIGSTIAANYNGGFEAGNTNGWSYSGTGIAFAAETTTVHSGTYAGQLTATSAATGQAQTNEIGCAVGDLVTVDAWVYVTAISAGSFTLTLDYLDGGGVQLSNTVLKTWTAVDTGWNRYTLRLGAPVGAQQAVLKLNAVAATGTVCIDDTYLHVG